MGDGMGLCVKQSIDSATSRFLVFPSTFRVRDFGDFMQACSILLFGLVELSERVDSAKSTLHD